jgi:hypothetical protein
MIVASVRTEPAFGLMVIALIIIFGPLVAQKLRLPGLIGLLIGRCCVDRSTGAARRFGVDVRSDRVGELIECCRET